MGWMEVERMGVAEHCFKKYKFDFEIESINNSTLRINKVYILKHSQLVNINMP